jgi:hypothetical protein
MFSQISYNVVIDRFKAFADGHYLIRRFSHGQIDKTDLEKDQQFPWMHVVPTSVTPSAGQRAYAFDIVFTDLPREKESNAEYQRESLSDCIRLAEDLLAEIRNGLTLFGSDVELLDNVSMQPFIEEYTHVLTGVTLSCTLVVPWNWSACDIPADYAPGGSGSGGTGGGGSSLTLKVNGVNNVVQNVLDLVEGTGMSITDNGDGSVTFTNTGGGGGGGDNVATEFNVNHTTLTGNQYVIGDRVWYNGNIYQCIANNDALLPTNTLYWNLVGSGFRLRQSIVDWNATSGDFQLLNKPTIPAAQVNSDWNASSGVAEILNKPTIPAAQVNSDWNAVSGVAEILNKPTIPAAQIQSDWNQSNNAALDFIKNKPTLTSGTVTSVALTMPAAFNVAGSPVTSAGTLAVSAAGLATQYVRGDGQLANFPTTGGGGSSVSYYLNGSINQGVIGGSTYYQMSKTAIFGAGTDFTRTNAAGNGLIAQFITDANDPNVLLVPGGNFNLELYFSASSSGGTPSFYVELYKYDGATFTLLATDVATPEGITQGTVIDAYFTALAVPPTTMALTDRLALRVFVTTSGRTLKLHTENSHLSQVITTLSTGINALNGLTDQVQNLAVGTAGTDFGISSAGSTHTFNLPTASASNRGALSSADWSTFNAKQAALVSGTNIKTVNSTSLLGSGNVAVAAQDSVSLINNTAVTIGASTTSYISFCAFTTNSAEASRQVIIPIAGTIKNLYVLTATTQSAAGSQVCTVRKNTADTAITTTIAASAAAGTFSDTTNSVSVAAGDKLSLKVQNNAASGTAAQIVSVAIIIERS